MVEKLPSQENNNQDIELRYGDTQAFVSLDGAYVTAFRVGGKDILCPSGIIKINEQEKRRDGIPLLFPLAGKGIGDIPQHGFARDMKWKENIAKELIPSRTLLKLQDTPETREIFPYIFEVNLKISLKRKTLFYKLDISNKDKKPIPVAPGLHPYFRVPEGEFDNIETNIDGLDLKKYQLTESLFFPLENLEVSIPKLGDLKMSYGGSFKREQSKLVVWTDNKNYICFEPWSTDVGGLYKEDQQLLIPPGEKASFSMGITLS